MTNLLPEKDRYRVRAERRRRFFATVLSGVFVIIVLGAVLLIPSYLLVSSQRNLAVAQLDTLSRLVELRKETSASELLRRLNEKATLVLSQKGQTHGSDVFADVIGRMSDEIFLFQLSYDASAGPRGSIVIEGVATSRPGLLSFGEALEESPFFSGVVIPVEVLTETKNIRFQLTLGLTNEGSYVLE